MLGAGGDREKVICRQVAAKISRWAAEQGVYDIHALCALSGMSEMTVRHALKNGLISLPAIIAMAEALGYDIEELISFTAEERDEWPERKEKSL